MRQRIADLFKREFNPVNLVGIEPEMIPTHSEARSRATMGSFPINSVSKVKIKGAFSGGFDTNLNGDLEAGYGVLPENNSAGNYDDLGAKFGEELEYLKGEESGCVLRALQPALLFPLFPVSSTFIFRVMADHGDGALPSDSSAGQAAGGSASM